MPETLEQGSQSLGFLAPRRFLIKTLGCKANLADSLELSRELTSQGWSEASGQDGALDLCIVNSCTVTDEADRQSRRLASKLARSHPGARVVVTGCAAEIDPERLAASAGIDYVVGNRDKQQLVELVLSRLSSRPREPRGQVLGSAEAYPELRSRHPEDRAWPKEWVSEAKLAKDHTRGFLKIQEGCNSFCTYCIIPYGRGPSRSLEPSEIVGRVRQACETGVREIVLTGTNLGDYGSDLTDIEVSFEELLKIILGETPLERLRLSSLDPTEITPGILSLMENEPRLCPHFHVSLQSPVDRVLKLMKRKYNSRQARDCLLAISELGPKPFVGMDLISGFPGESEADFEESMRFLEETPWSRLHVFPYSERKGTPATRLPESVPQSLRVSRARSLRELSLKRLSAHYERKRGSLPKGCLPGVLFEKPDGAEMHGFSRDYLRVSVAARPGVRNSVGKVSLAGIRVEPASGEVLFEGTLLSLEG